LTPPNFNPLLAPGQTFSHTSKQAGEYTYYCAMHPNMDGTIGVKADLRFFYFPFAKLRPRPLKPATYFLSFVFAAFG
jgi:hypothetical protein